MYGKRSDILLFNKFVGMISTEFQAQPRLGSRNELISRKSWVLILKTEELCFSVENVQLYVAVVAGM
jgi:hypothetical protein